MLQYLIDNGLDINTHSPLLGTFVYETSYDFASNDEIRKFLLENGHDLTYVDLEQGSVDIYSVSCFNMIVRSVNLMIMHSGVIIKIKKQEISKRRKDEVLASSDVRSGSDGVVFGVFERSRGC